MFCIYVFSDEDCIPKYIGKAKCFDKRIKQHLNRDRFKYKSWFYNWLNKQITENKIFYIDILEEVNQENHIEREKYWIKNTKDLGYILTNMTDGGDGNNNQIFSKESGLKRAEKLKGKPRDALTRLKISKGHLGKKLSDSTKQKLREINLGKIKTKEQRLKLAKKVVMKDLNNKIIKEFDSITDAATFISSRKGTISTVIKKKIPIYKNFLWELK